MKPIIFDSDAVRSILAGRKTQFRVPVKPQSRIVVHPNGQPLTADGWLASFDNPFGTPGDRLWVRETWQYGEEFEVSDAKNGRHPEKGRIYYAADDNHFFGRPWRSPTHMTKCASRLTLEIVSVRVERVQEITKDDALAEGCTVHQIGGDGYCKIVGGPISSFRARWNCKYAKRGYSWSSNPWVFVYQYRKVEPTVVEQELKGSV